MPEQREPTAEALKLKHAIFQALSEGSDFSSVISLWCDATNSEAAKSSKDSCFHRNHVDQIDASCIFECGQTKAQDQLFPPQIVNKKEKPGDLVISDLFLKGPDSISATARALILDLGPLKLLFAFLTHCNSNLYSHEQWENNATSALDWHLNSDRTSLHLSLLISYSESEEDSNNGGEDNDSDEFLGTKTAIRNSKRTTQSMTASTSATSSSAASSSATSSSIASSSATSSVASSSTTSSVASSSAATAPSSVIDVDVVDSDLEHEAFADGTDGAASPDQRPEFLKNAYARGLLCIATDTHLIPQHNYFIFI
ncbi:hypothetical protein BT96DRAFT_941467 [Gymnopus androsaceus JB14]|uniref:Uncharacterized protein n=1 Tax=Gymnopus androsaceus JB14 TaxID=1447944 RepID=A0A6A4HIF4_9AGAR|nr:hypothetical protein BT96DRAFT_941467 [Gymnopus androsaceus JB14]